MTVEERKVKYKSEELTWPDFERIVKGGAIAVFAVGAHEEHGPHCGLQTDTIMSQALAERIADQINAILLPAIPYGECWSTSKYPGTITLQPETLIALVTDIAKSLQKNLVRGLIIVNGHFGNKSPLFLASSRIKETLDYPVMVLDYPDMDRIFAEVCESKPPAPGFYHADEFETSVILAEAPHTVQMEKAEPGYPIFPITYSVCPTFLSDFNPNGIFGDPTKATAEKGRLILDALTEASIPIVNAFIESL